jgi:nitrate reductase gamma subunit
VTVLLYFVVYAAVLTFIVASITRAVRYAKAPLHLRWELYPVPHEAPERAAHGGSYFETSDWWKEKRTFNLIGELASMLPEMILLKGLWEFNRKLWRVSFLFHFGLYLLITTLGLVLVTAVLSLGLPGFALAIILAGAYRITATLGVVLVLLGATGLLLRRLTDKALKNYTTPADIFNLLFFLATLAVLVAGYLSRPSGIGVQQIARGILSFDTTLSVPPLLAVGLMLGATLMAYIPLTHMSHFIAKYFTYHNVRWDDAPNLKGGRIEAKLAEYLAYRPNWSAAHMGADGTKTWVDIATTNPNDLLQAKTAAAAPEGKR